MIAHAMMATRAVDVSPVDGTSPALGLWLALAAAHASMVERLDPQSGDTCSTLGSDAVAVLLPLAGAPDHQLRMHELADRSHLTRSGLTRRIDRLVAEGLVARVTCPSDRRGAYAQATAAGLADLASALPHHVASLAGYINTRLSAAEVVTLTDLLRRI